MFGEVQWDYVLFERICSYAILQLSNMRKSSRIFFNGKLAWVENSISIFMWNLNISFLLLFKHFRLGYEQLNWRLADVLCSIFLSFFAQHKQTQAETDSKWSLLILIRCSSSKNVEFTTCILVAVIGVWWSAFELKTNYINVHFIFYWQFWQQLEYVCNTKVRNFNVGPLHYCIIQFFLKVFSKMNEKAPNQNRVKH